jgi:hypothetical protein
LNKRIKEKKKKTLPTHHHLTPPNYCTYHHPHFSLHTTTIMTLPIHNHTHPSLHTITFTSFLHSVTLSTISPHNYTYPTSLPSPITLTPQPDSKHPHSPKHTVPLPILLKLNFFKDPGPIREGWHSYLNSPLLPLYVPCPVLLNIFFICSSPSMDLSLARQ